MKYFSMFSGIGGVEYGIEKAYGNWRNAKELSKDDRLLPSINTGNGQGGWTHPNCVGYSEIDKYSIETYKKHFGGHKNYGDATKIKPEELPNFDMLCGGFPCQAFSIAGKRRGFEDTRGTLFFDIARILKIKKPTYIFLENVKGLLNHNKGETFTKIIQTLDELGYEVEWMVLNSKFFGVPQNRERVFIIGCLRGTSRPEILPIGESSKEIDKTSKQISSTIGAGYYKQGGRDQQYVNEKGFGKDRQGSFITESKLSAQEESIKINSATQKGYSEAKLGDGIRLEYPESKTARGRVIKGNSNTLKSGTEGVVVMDLYNNKEHSDRSPTLTEPHHNTLRVREGLKIRRLTPIECERLQGFPDNWTEGVSDTQRYKQCGNAVTTNVITAIFTKFLHNATKENTTSEESIK